MTNQPGFLSLGTVSACQNKREFVSKTSFGNGFRFVLILFSHQFVQLSIYYHGYSVVASFLWLLNKLPTSAYKVPAYLSLKQKLDLIQFSISAILITVMWNFKFLHIKFISTLRDENLNCYIIVKTAAKCTINGISNKRSWTTFIFIIYSFVKETVMACYVAALFSRLNLHIK